MPRFISNVLTIFMMMWLVLLARHVDDLTYEVAKSYASMALQLSEVYESKPSPALAAKINEMKEQAKSICLQSFISTGTIPGARGRCSDFIANQSNEVAPLEHQKE